MTIFNRKPTPEQIAQEAQWNKEREDAAATWLRQCLALGPVPRQTVLDEADAYGHRDLLEMTRIRLGIIRTGHGWMLPRPPRATATRPQREVRATPEPLNFVASRSMFR